MRALRRYVPIALIVLGLFGGTIAITANQGSVDVKPHLPKLGHVPTKPQALERQVKAAQEAATNRCPLPEKVAEERKVVNGAPGVQKAVDHDMGDCAPGPPGRASVTARSSLGVDRSNNNPSYGASLWRGVRSAGVSYVWLKTSEGATFTDRTTATMAHDARAAGLLVGGYHFAHACMTSPAAEASLFVRTLRASQLDTPTSARPILDVEYGGCSTASGTRAWIVSLYNAVQGSLRGVRLGVYSGNWWIGPRTDCLFAHLPKTTLSWISGYPNAVAPCGHGLDVHQFSDASTTGPIRGDANRLRAASFDDLFAGGHAAPPEAEHQCRMYNHYHGWFVKYTRRREELHAQGKGLGQFATRRLSSAYGHVAAGKHYFTKNHEHGKVNYDCVTSGPEKGHVRVRTVEAAPKPRPKPKPRKHTSTSVSAPFRIVGGRAPAPSLIAPYIDIITDGATVNSVYRGADAATILHTCGLHTQAEVFATSPPGVANPPGFSTHEDRSDGVVYSNAPRGSKLATWQTGVDVNDADVAGVIHHAHALGWVVFQPYPGSRVEFHHVNFLVRPSARGALRDKIRARRERLPTHC